MTIEEKIHAFYAEVMRGGDAQAAEKYLHPGYRQHNPGVADGRDGFIETFGRDFAKGKKFNVEIADLIFNETKTLVAVVLRVKRPDGSFRADGAVVDFYRIDENGMLTEHWDVLNP